MRPIARRGAHTARWQSSSRRWEERRHHPSTILAGGADLDHTVAEAWGVWGEESREGRTYEGLIRSSFLVDADGRIREAWYQAAPERTVPLALEAISAA